MNFDCILFCSTTGYFLPFFFPPKKMKEEGKENEVAKPVFQDAFEIHYDGNKTSLIEMKVICINLNHFSRRKTKPNF